ncbi:MAG: class I SAM-dependent methyltransferase [Betaproteobacteria bacterium]
MKELLSLATSARRYADELGVKPDIHLDDFIFGFLIDNPSFDCVDSAVRYYFHDARKSAEQLRDLLDEIGSPRSESRSMLEFASGYGCVTRHLSKVMPGVRSTACDIHAQAVQFIRDRLDAAACLSCENPDEFDTGQRYDVVFALSFFSHMPSATWERWLAALYRSVSDGGALAFTTQGPHSAKFFGNPEIGPDGFWFLADSEQKDLDVATYGQTLVSEAFVQGALIRLTGRKADLVRPGYWWGHQDLYVLRKPGA